MIKCVCVCVCVRARAGAACVGVRACVHVCVSVGGGGGGRAGGGGEGNCGYAIIRARDKPRAAYEFVYHSEIRAHASATEQAGEYGNNFLPRIIKTYKQRAGSHTVGSCAG